MYKFKNTNKLAPNIINDFANTNNFGEFRSESYLSNRLDLNETHREEIVGAILNFSQIKLTYHYIEFGNMYVGNDDEMYNFIDFHIDSFPNIVQELKSMRNDYSKAYQTSPYINSIALMKYIIKTFYTEGVLPLISEDKCLLIRNNFFYYIKSDANVAKFVNEIIEFCNLPIVHIASMQQNIELYLLAKFIYSDTMKYFSVMLNDYQNLFNSASTKKDVKKFLKKHLDHTAFPNRFNIAKPNNIQTRKRALNIDFDTTDVKEDEILPTEMENQNEESLIPMDNTADNVKNDVEGEDFNTSQLLSSVPNKSTPIKIKKTTVKITPKKTYNLRR